MLREDAAEIGLVGEAQQAGDLLGKGPDYAVKVIMADLGPFDGIRTSVVGEVVDATDRPIPGLYSVGNDRAAELGPAHGSFGANVAAAARRPARSL